MRCTTGVLQDNLVLASTTMPNSHRPLAPGSQIVPQLQLMRPSRPVMRQVHGWCSQGAVAAAQPLPVVSQLEALPQVGQPTHTRQPAAPTSGQPRQACCTQIATTPPARSLSTPTPTVPSPAQYPALSLHHRPLRYPKTPLTHMHVPYQPQRPRALHSPVIRPLAVHVIPHSHTAAGVAGVTVANGDQVARSWVSIDAPCVAAESALLVVHHLCLPGASTIPITYHCWCVVSTGSASSA